MKLLPSSDQITNDLNDIRLRIAKMNARRNAQINLLQKKITDGSLRSKYYPPWSRSYYRRLHHKDPILYRPVWYPSGSHSLDSLELDKYYDSLNLDDRAYICETENELINKYKSLAKVNPTNTDILSKLKDFVFEQERQMTTDLLRKISQDRKLRSSDRFTEYRNPAYDVPLKSDPPFLNPINKKDNFYKRYNAFIKKIFKPLQKPSSVKFGPPKTPRISRTTPLYSTNTTYLDDYYYPSEFYRPDWYRSTLYPFYRRYPYDNTYLPKLQPATVPLDVESIIRKSNINEDKKFKPITNTSNYLTPTSPYKYDPFESDSYLRSSLPTWKQYYYTQKLKSKPSNECFLDYYDPYYDFFSDRASLDSTDDLLSTKEVPPELSDQANQLVNEYRNAIYEDIIQNLKQKQSISKIKPALRADRTLFGYRGKNHDEERPVCNYFNIESHRGSNNTHHPRTTENVSKNFGGIDYQTKYQTYNYQPKEESNSYSRNNLKQDENLNASNMAPRGNIRSDYTDPGIKYNFDQPENYYEMKLDDSYKPKTISTNENQTNPRTNVISPSNFHSKCTTPVDNYSLNRYSSSGAVSPSKARPTISNVGSKVSGKNVAEEYYTPDGKSDQYQPIDYKFSSIQNESKHPKYTDSETRQINAYKSNTSPIRFTKSEIEQDTEEKPQEFPLDDLQSDKFRPINSPTKQKLSNTDLNFKSQYLPKNETTTSSLFTPTDTNKYQKKNFTSEKQNDSSSDKNISESEFRKPAPRESIGNVNKEILKSALGDRYTPKVSTQRQLNSPTEKRPSRPSVSEIRDTKDLPQEYTGESKARNSVDYPLKENFRRSSSTRSIQLVQPTPTTDKVPLSRRNSVIFENNRSIPSQPASRRNSIRPTLQRKNSIQATISEKRNLLHKMDYDTKNDSNEHQPEISKEKLVKSNSIEEKTEKNNEAFTYQPARHLVKKSSSDEVFVNTEEDVSRKMNDFKDNSNALDGNQLINTDNQTYQYNSNLNEENLINNYVQENSKFHPESKYYENQPSSYDENSKDSLGRDNYAEKSDPVYPEYNYNEGHKFDETKTQENYFTDRMYQPDPNQNITNDQNNQNNYHSTESYPNDYSGYYNQSQSAISDQDYTTSQDQNEQQRLTSDYSDYLGTGSHENTSLTNQDSYELSQPQKSFEPLDENARINTGFASDPDHMKSTELKEQEPSLNSINEEAEKFEKIEGKPKKSITSDKSNTQQQPSDESVPTSVDTIKPKRSVDLGRIRELARRTSRSALLSQSSDDRRIKNQSSTGELQKRLSKPKIGESKLKRTASTFKVKPTPKKL